MKSKHEILEIFLKFHVSSERENNKCSSLKTRNGGEYCSNAFKNYCNKFCIKHEKIVLGTL